MYGNGGAEEVVAEAIAGQRDRVFVVTKVLPQNASRAGVPAACERSLRRLRTDVHRPLSAALARAASARRDGRSVRGAAGGGQDPRAGACRISIPRRHGGTGRRAGGGACATNQVLYHPDSRGIEFDLLPWCAAHRMPVMAYSPVGQGGRLLRSRGAGEVAKRHDATPAQIAIAWGLRHPDVITIPKAGRCGACAGETRGGRDRPDRGGSGGDRRRPSATRSQAGARQSLTDTTVNRAQPEPDNAWERFPRQGRHLTASPRPPPHRVGLSDFGTARGRVRYHPPRDRVARPGRRSPDDRHPPCAAGRAGRGPAGAGRGWAYCRRDGAAR